MLTGAAIGFILWLLLVMWNLMEAYARETHIDDIKTAAAGMFLVSVGATIGYIVEVMW